jgi:hypothetical protein
MHDGRFGYANYQYESHCNDPVIEKHAQPCKSQSSFCRTCACLQAVAAATPAGPVTQQDLEILEYKRKLCKLEKIKREWNEAFDEKLNKYR